MKERPKREKLDILTPPKAASSITWTIAGCGIWTLLIWVADVIVHTAGGSVGSGYIPKTLQLRHILGGSLWLLIGLYSVWSWQPGRKNAQLHRWLAAVLVVIYPSGMMLLFSSLLWQQLLFKPWNWLMNMSLWVFYGVAWVLPVLFPSLAKRLEQKQRSLDLLLLRFGIPTTLIASGVIGASFGLHGKDERLWIMAILSALAVGWAQYASSILWPYRPWAKYSENAKG